jgi:hypothetical protein
VTKSTLISKGIFEYWQTWSDHRMGAAHPNAVPGASKRRGSASILRICADTNVDSARCSKDPARQNPKP